MLGFTILTSVPVRVHPSEKAEMVTQLIFGDLYHVISTSQDSRWVKITTVYDDYEGWIDAKVHNRLQKEEFESLQLHQNAGYFVTDSLGMIESDDEVWRVSYGSVLPHPSHFIIGKREFKVKCQTQPLPKAPVEQPSLEILSLYCTPFLNTPYLWGGKSIMGIDCSGLVQIVMRTLGIKLPRDTYQQVEHGREISFSEHRTGDLAFFSNPEGRVTHVGIVWAKNAIFHASGRVRIDKLNEIGIFNSETGFNTHFLHSIRRVF